jgi:hypothetical protein
MVGRSHWGIRGAIILLWFDNALRKWKCDQVIQFYLDAYPKNPEWSMINQHIE